MARHRRVPVERAQHPTRGMKLYGRSADGRRVVVEVDAVREGTVLYRRQATGNTPRGLGMVTLDQWRERLLAERDALIGVRVPQKG